MWYNKKYDLLMDYYCITKLLGSCFAVRYQLATSISETCSGFKLLLDNSWPWESFDRCCGAVNKDAECGNKFFVYPVTGKCVCEKKGHSCSRSFGLSTELRTIPGK